MQRLILLCFAFFLASSSPLSAHGDEKHGGRQDAPMGAVEQPHPTPDSHEKVSASIDVEASSVKVNAVNILRMLHPSTVHFPIALLLLATTLEGLGMFRPSVELQYTVKVVLYFAAAGTLLAVIFGWIHTGMWMGGEALMQRHRWTGSGLAVLSIGLAWLASRAPESSRTMLRAGLAIAAILVVAQGYWGAELSHGPDHLTPAH